MRIGINATVLKELCLNPHRTASALSQTLKRGLGESTERSQKFLVARW